MSTVVKTSKSHDSPVVRIPGCLPGDLGSIPSRGVFYLDAVPDVK